LIASFDSARVRNLGLRLGIRYTYAINRDNLSSTFSEFGNNFNLGYLDPFNPNLDYGFSDNDIRHRFVTNFTWEIPSPKSANGWLKQVVGGWELTGIYTARSGAPFSVFDCTFAFGACSRAILSGPVNFKGSINHDSIGVVDTPNRYQYISLSGLTPGEFRDVNGMAEFPPFPSNMAKRSAFRGPGIWNVDAALYKNFQIKEGKRIQLRLETYNTFNHANLFAGTGEAEVNTGATTDSNGVTHGGYVPASFFGRRNVQLAGKFIF